MRMPLSEFKSRVALYFSVEDLVELLDIDPETFVDIMEDELWKNRRTLIEEMGLGDMYYENGDEDDE